MAVVAEVELVAVAALPASAPVNAPVNKLAGLVAINTLVKLLEALRKATLVRSVLATVPVNEEAGMFVNPTPLPVKLVAVMVPAEKLPEASRETMLSGVFALAAPLAAMAPLATAEADCPPTVETTVAL